MKNHLISSLLPQRDPVRKPRTGHYIVKTVHADGSKHYWSEYSATIHEQLDKLDALVEQYPYVYCRDNRGAPYFEYRGRDGCAEMTWLEDEEVFGE